LTAGALSSLYLYTTLRQTRNRNPEAHIVPSPLRTLLPNLSPESIRKLPYPPDLFPGARDFETPYGSIRIYEWGPEEGRKVLLVHGISTPSLSLGRVGEGLVERGCRVMMFDLFGRGYTDDPSDLPHDSRLYTTQILLAISSSPLPWTGTNAFSIIGYSLGGGIATAFTSTFPTLVSSLIVIAPSGLLRESHIAWQSKILYSTEGILPESLVQWLVRRRLGGGSASAPATSGVEEKTGVEDALAAERGDGDGVAFPRRPLVNIEAAVQWQLDTHVGFIPAFISSIRHAPIQNQHHHWKTIGARLTAQKANSDDGNATNNGLERSKVLMILGRKDSVIVKREVEVDAEECLGEGNLQVVTIEAGHDVPISNAQDVVEAVMKFW
ncbi:alpha/beta-hydrolase, partial [Tothia fuscella]